MSDSTARYPQHTLSRQLNQSLSSWLMISSVDYDNRGNGHSMVPFPAEAQKGKRAESPRRGPSVAQPESPFQTIKEPSGLC